MNAKEEMNIKKYKSFRLEVEQQSSYFDRQGNHFLPRTSRFQNSCLPPLLAAFFSPKMQMQFVEGRPKTSGRTLEETELLMCETRQKHLTLRNALFHKLMRDHSFG